MQYIHRKNTRILFRYTPFHTHQNMSLSAVIHPGHHDVSILHSSRPGHAKSHPAECAALDVKGDGLGLSCPPWHVIGTVCGDKRLYKQNAMCDKNVPYCWNSKWYILQKQNNILSHCGLMTPYGDIDLGEHSCNAVLLPDGTKPLPEPMLNNHWWGFLALTWG